ELGKWMSDYYGAPLGLALRAILPGPLWSVARPAGPAPAAERLLVLTGNGLGSLLERERRFKRTPKRRAVYETVEALGGPAPVSRVGGVFGNHVAVLHSGLSDGERADAWRALRRGERLVAVGPRSAVFAPVQRLGAIVVDEEHEPSYKQGSVPRYHARDAAAVRARLEGARLILGSA